MAEDGKYHHDRLFSFGDLGSNASDYLASWFAKREEIDSVLVLYFNTLYAPAPFADGRLLNLVQALESYHRRVIGGSDLPKAEHQERVKAVLASVPSDLTEWVESKLEHSNEVSLMTRIKWIFSEFGDVLKPVLTDPDKTAKQLRDNRNYMTHFDVGLKKVWLGLNWQGLLNSANCC